MKLATIQSAGRRSIVLCTSAGAITLHELAKVQDELKAAAEAEDMLDLLRGGQWDVLRRWYHRGGRQQLADIPCIPQDQLHYMMPYAKPGKVIGIGMNYVNKAIELAGRPEEEPVIFLKPDTTLIGWNEAIRLPEAAGLITAEAELALIMGETCRYVSEAEALTKVAGYTTALDMTARDIFLRNPRYMQRAKSFDTFCSFGPVVYSLDELMLSDELRMNEEAAGSSEVIATDEHVADKLAQLEVATLHNGEIIHRNSVANMIYSPAQIIAFVSSFMTLHAGDVILTGTPGSVALRAGDDVGGKLTGMESISHPVIMES